MSFAVVTSAWRRPYYSERTLASWAVAAAMMRPDRFVISLGTSDRYAEVLKVIEAARTWFDVELEVVTQSLECYGNPHRAYGEMASYVFSDPAVEFLVVGEDDVLVSDDVLLYMDWARRRFQAEEDVLAVCAHNRGGQYWDPHVPAADADADQQAVRVVPYFNAWGWGLWRDRWEEVVLPGWCWQATGFATGYDFAIAANMGFWCSVVPDASRSQNIGEQEGIYVTPESWSFSQSQSFREHRGPVIYQEVQ
jgi:hypothetical protein